MLRNPVAREYCALSVLQWAVERSPPPRKHRAFSLRYYGAALPGFLLSCAMIVCVPGLLAHREPATPWLGPHPQQKRNSCMWHRSGGLFENGLAIGITSAVVSWWPVATGLAGSVRERSAGGVRYFAMLSTAA